MSWILLCIAIGWFCTNSKPRSIAETVRRKLPHGWHGRIQHFSHHSSCWKTWAMHHHVEWIEADLDSHSPFGNIKQRILAQFKMILEWWRVVSMKINLKNRLYLPWYTQHLREGLKVLKYKKWLGTKFTFFTFTGLTWATGSLPVFLSWDWTFTKCNFIVQYFTYETLQ